MSKKKCHKAKKMNFGLVVASIGIGIIITVMIPIWGWIMFAGAGLIAAGWYIIQNFGN